MAVAIPIVQNDNTHFFALRSPAVVDWNLIPANLYFFWLMTDAVPANFSHTAEYPALDEIETYSDYTDWLFEVTLQFTGSIPFLKVEGGASYSGALGTPFSNGGDYYRKVLNFSFANLNLLSVGQYYCTVKYAVTALNPTTGLRESISEKELSIAFRAARFYYGSPFEVSYPGWAQTAPGVYAPLVFNYHLGDALPTAKDIYYFRNLLFYTPALLTPSDASIVTVNSVIHDYFSKVAVSFNSSITSLDVGTYAYTLEMHYFVFTGYVGRIVDIILNVFPASSGFAVTPGEVEFDVIIGGPTPDQQVLSLASTNPWTLIGDLPSWLELSQYSGTGNATILLTAVNYNELATADYSFNLVFESNGEQITVPVLIHVVAFLINPFLPGKIYFTKALDYLRFASTTPGTYLEITVDISVYKINSNELVQYTREYTFPLFQGTGKFHIGSIVHTLFEEIMALEDYVPDHDSNYYKNQYLPADVTVAYEEKVFTGAPPAGLVSTSLPAFKMIKGHKPYVTDSQIALLTVAQQDVTRITPKSVIGVSFTHLNTPRILVKRNDIVLEDFTIATFSQNNLQKIIFSYFRFINDLKPGDSVDIVIMNALETRSQRFIVFPAGMESTFFFFENDNGVMEPFEFTGRRRISTKMTHETGKRFKDLFAYETKAVSKNMQSFIVNTGNLTKTEHRIVDAIIKSKVVWCCLDNASGTYFRVDSITSKLSTQDTSNPEENFDVEFNILENADAIIYPL